MTPDAGSSDGVDKNRGMVFVPEAGDHVMVGFEFGDPNRPYVMGSLFHGKNAAGGGANNAVKSIITGSGIKIVFNDSAKSLHIEDPSGNTWDMDGNGNIAVNAPNDINLQAKNINLSAEENVLVSARKNVTEIAGEVLSVQSKNKTERVEEQMTADIQKDMTLKVGAGATVTVSDDMQLTAGKIIADATDADMLLNATGKITFKSGDIVDIAQ
jgi:uncharacterized protein involved in type VI secretion and phage assembly